MIDWSMVASIILGLALWELTSAIGQLIYYCWIVNKREK